MTPEGFYRERSFPSSGRCTGCSGRRDLAERAGVLEREQLRARAIKSEPKRASRMKRAEKGEPRTATRCGSGRAARARIPRQVAVFGSLFSARIIRLDLFGSQL